MSFLITTGQNTAQGPPIAQHAVVPKPEIEPTQQMSAHAPRDPRKGKVKPLTIRLKAPPRSANTNGSPRWLPGAHASNVNTPPSISPDASQGYGRREYRRQPEYEPNYDSAAVEMLEMHGVQVVRFATTLVTAPLQVWAQLRNSALFIKVTAGVAASSAWIQFTRTSYATLEVDAVPPVHLRFRP